MKKFKRIISIMLVTVMALAMSMTAFAAEQKKVTINNPVKGHTYTAYQIFKGTVATDGKLENLNWGDNITDAGKTALKVQLGLGDGVTVAQVAVKLAEIENNSAEMDAVAQILGDNKTGNGVTLTAEDNKVSATVDQGYYVIIDTLGDGADADSTVSKYMVQVVGDVDINTKAQPTSSQKTVKDQENAYKQFTEANIGEERTFYLLATLPDDYAAYEAFYMNFQDTMNHMEFAGITKVSVKKDVTTPEGSKKKDPMTGTEVASINAQTENEKINGYKLTNNVTAGAATGNFSVEILDLKQIVPTAKAGDCVVVEYVAKLNSTAAINAANENEFDLVFSNDPNSKWKPTTPNPDESTPPTGVTPKDKAEVYTTEIELLKIDGTTKDVLKGAGFTLTGESTDVVIKTVEDFVEDENGTYYKLKNDTYTTTAPTDDTSDSYASTTQKYSATTKTVVVGANQTEKNITAIVGDDGKVTFSGLGEGKYTLTETTPPAGYNTMDPKSFEISFDRTKKEFGVTGGLTTLVATIENFSGSLLPSTGGIGTTIFYVVGAILVIGAGVILVAKKRMSQEQ